MPLQIRRGPTADRVAFTPVEGELIFDTQSKSLYIGDGSTTGGIAAAGLTAADVRDSVGSLFADGTHDYITFTYDPEGETISTVIDLTTYDGTIQAAGFKGTVYGDDSTTLINSVNSSINLDGTVKGNIVPDTDEAYDLGTSSAKFRDLYLAGSSIYLGSANITATGTVVNLPAGSTVGGTVIGTGSGTGDGVVEGSTYKINIAADDSTILVNSDTQTFTGSLIGDVRGSVFADDSNIMVDAVDNSINAGSGTFTTVSAFTVDSTSSLRLEALAGSINLRSSGGYIVLGSGTDNVNSNLFINRSLYGSTDIDGVVVRTNHGFTPEMDGLKFSRSRGTGSSPLTVTTNDILGQIDFSGYDGSNYVQSYDIYASVDSVSSGIVTSILNFRSTDTFGNLTPRMRFFPDGRVLVGPASVGDTGSGSLEIFSTVNAGFSTNNGQPLVIRQFFNGQDCNNITSARARGTREVPTAVLLNDKTLEISATGFDGTNQANSAGIATFIDGAISAGVTPGRISFFTTNAAGTYAGRVTISSEGRLIALFGISGDLTGDLTGSVFSDSSTMLIDGTSGSLMAANINIVGQTGNTPVSTVSPSEWLEVSVNGNSRYIPLYT